MNINTMGMEPLIRLQNLSAPLWPEWPHPLSLYRCVRILIGRCRTHCIVAALAAAVLLEVVELVVVLIVVFVLIVAIR